MAHARTEHPADAIIDATDDTLGPEVIEELRKLHDAKLPRIDHRLGSFPDVRPSSTRHVAADLADLYAGSKRMRLLLDALLETPPTERERAASRASRRGSADPRPSSG